MKKIVKKTTEKYLTLRTFNRFEARFDVGMRAVAKSFSDNTEVTAAILRQLEKINKTLTTHEQVMQIMLKEITAIHEDTKSFRDNISTLYTDHVGYDRKINDLGVRVEKLESK